LGSSGADWVHIRHSADGAADAVECDAPCDADYRAAWGATPSDATGANRPC